MHDAAESKYDGPEKLKLLLQNGVGANIQSEVSLIYKVKDVEVSFVGFDWDNK